MVPTFMQIAPVEPDNRVAALVALILESITVPLRKEILDTVLKDIAATYGTPMAMIALPIVNGLTFPATVGMELAGVAFQDSDEYQLGRNVSRRIPTVVLDTMESDHFRHSELVAGPCAARMFAAAPLQWDETTYVGCLCINEGVR